MIYISKLFFMSFSPLRQAKYLDRAAQGIMLVALIAAAFVVDSKLTNAFIFPKEYIVGLLTLAILIVLACKVILTRKVSYYQSKLDIPILVFLGVNFLSALFSSSRADSFLGRSDFFIWHFIFALCTTIIFLATVQYFRNRAAWQLAIDVVLAISGVMTTLFLIKAFFAKDLFSFLLPNIWNTFDQANSLFALVLLASFIIVAGQLIKKDLSSLRVGVNIGLCLLFFVALIVMNFSTLWWLLLAGVLLLLFVGSIFLREARLPWLSALFAIIIATAVFIGFNAPTLTSNNLPAEIVLNRSSSWTLASESLFSSFKSTLVGNGLGTFGTVFSRFRNPNFNADPYAWSLRFNQPFSSLYAVLAEGGLSVTLVLLFIIVFTIGIVGGLAKQARTEAHEQTVVQFFDDDASSAGKPYIEVISLSIAWIVLTIGLVFFYFGPTPWLLWWFTLGLVIAGASFCKPELIRHREYIVEDSPEYTLSFSFATIVVLAGVVIAGVWGVRLYAAERNYTAGLRATSFADAEQFLGQAISYRNNNEQYHVALAQVYLLEATDETRNGHTDVQKVGSLVQYAVNEARIATDFAPQSVAVWENLAVMYENAATLIPEARSWAIKSLNQARELEPSNPVLLWRLGNDMMLSGKVDDAIKDYEAAIALKQDYINAYVSLATAYEQQSNTNKATDIYALLVQSSPNNVDYLYNYARLIYNRNNKGDRDTAEKIWLKIVEVQPNYSNALYSLGYLYENRKEKGLAVEYYSRVLTLNPNNKELKAKINSLK